MDFALMEMSGREIAERLAQAGLEMELTRQRLDIVIAPPRTYSEPGWLSNVPPIDTSPWPFTRKERWPGEGDPHHGNGSGPGVGAYVGKLYLHPTKGFRRVPKRKKHRRRRQ